jgi:hypothetical protein
MFHRYSFSTIFCRLGRYTGTFYLSASGCLFEVWRSYMGQGIPEQRLVEPMYFHWIYTLKFIQKNHHELSDHIVSPLAALAILHNICLFS